MWNLAVTTRLNMCTDHSYCTVPGPAKAAHWRYNSWEYANYLLVLVWIILHIIHIVNTYCQHTTYLCQTDNDHRHFSIHYTHRKPSKNNFSQPSLRHLIFLENILGKISIFSCFETTICWYVWRHVDYFIVVWRYESILYQYDPSLCQSWDKSNK